MSTTPLHRRTDPVEGDWRVARVRVVERIEPNEKALLAFTDPSPHWAMVRDASLETMPSESVNGDRGELVDILILPTSPSTQADGPAADAVGRRWIGAEGTPEWEPPITCSYSGADITWRRGRALLRCAPGLTNAMLQTIAHFSYYEGELRRLEREIAAAWTDLERDKRLAYEVTSRDLHDERAVGVRVEHALGRRIRHVRIEPHLYRTEGGLSATAQKLGEELRERALVEDRLETVDGQLEVFEHVYEMTSQRLGEFRASHKEQRLEWAIIVLLAAETLMLLLQLHWTMRS